MTENLDHKPATHLLDEVLFDVKRIPLVAKVPDSTLGTREIEVSRYEALQNSQNGKLLCVVSKDYELVTNRQAMETGKQIFCELFPSVKKDDLVPFKVMASKNLTTCHIDLIHNQLRLNDWGQDIWMPFLRISNSYNRTFALSFEIGFVRKLCSNGFIFHKNSIHVKYNHRKGEIPIDFKVDVSGLRNYELEFVNYMNNLNRFYVDPAYVFPLILKALNLNFDFTIKDEKMLDKELEHYTNTRNQVGDLTAFYYRELKPTAYAVLNILTDYISHQHNYRTIPLFSKQINHYYRLPSLWMLDFTNEIQKKDFNMDQYLGLYAQYKN